MTALVTGSSGHLGEALMRTLHATGRTARGVDVLESEFTTRVGSITNRSLVKELMAGVSVVFHAATLHKPHVATHKRQDFVDTNVTGTLNLLEEAVAAGVEAFVFTSTTSVFGDALIPAVGLPAEWITEDITPIPKNIYGVTKSAAEDFCQLFHRNHKLSVIVLRTSRFFPEEDDDPTVRDKYAIDNIQLNEFLYRRVDIEDVVSAHLVAAERAKHIGFGKYVVSATTPFHSSDLAELRVDASAVVRRRVPEYVDEYARRGWTMTPHIDRVYVNHRARKELGWQPKHDFRSLIARLSAGNDLKSPMAKRIGSKGYHRTD